jgi:hypothetical protein
VIALIFDLFAQLGRDAGSRWCPHSAPNHDVDPDDLALFDLRGQLDQAVADIRCSLRRQVGVLQAACWHVCLLPTTLMQGSVDVSGHSGTLAQASVATPGRLKCGESARRS